MALDWLTVLKLVPWGEVIDTAPKVARGAQKLWSSVTKKPAEPESAEPVADETAALRAQLAALQASQAQMQQQLQEAAALVQSLAQQQMQLVGRVQRLRTVLMGLGALSLGLVVALILRW
ncbi:MAG: hypothetical protein Fur007_12880 [Rhodoferax sp.]